MGATRSAMVLPMCYLERSILPENYLFLSRGFWIVIFWLLGILMI